MTKIDEKHDKLVNEYFELKKQLSKTNEKLECLANKIGYKEKHTFKANKQDPLGVLLKFDGYEKIKLCPKCKQEIKNDKYKST